MFCSESSPDVDETNDGNRDPELEDSYKGLANIRCVFFLIVTLQTTWLICSLSGLPVLYRGRIRKVLDCLATLEFKSKSQKSTTSEFSFLIVCDTCIKMDCYSGCFTRPLRLVVRLNFSTCLVQIPRRSPLAWVARLTSMQLEVARQSSFYQPSSLKTAIYKMRRFRLLEGVKKLSKVPASKENGNILSVPLAMSYTPANSKPNTMSTIYHLQQLMTLVCLLFLFF